MDLGHVLRMAAKYSDAAQAVTDALHLYERKGNAISAAQAQNIVAELDAVAGSPAPGRA